MSRPDPIQYAERLYAAISVFNGYGEMTSRSVIFS